MLWKKVLLASIVSVACLALLELTVRVLHLAPGLDVISLGRFKISQNPLLGYEPVPNYEYHDQELYFFEFRGKSNNLGFRDRDHAITKAEGVYRVLVIGDSITMGLGIERTEDVYTHLLERLLRSRRHSVEVLNFGVSGYNTQQEVQILIEKGLPFEPDLVIVGYCPNDTEMMNGGIVQALHEREESSAGLDRNLLIPYLSRSDLYCLVYSRLWATKLHQALDARGQQLKTDTVKESFSRLRELADQHRFKVLITIFPGTAPAFEEKRYEYAVRLSDANHFDRLDLRSSFRTCSKDERGFDDLLGDQIHPNARGHRCAAEALAADLVTKRLVPPTQP